MLNLFGLGANNSERRGEAPSHKVGNIYNRSNIDDILYSKRVPVFLVVHSESCPACRNFMPTWSNVCNNIVRQYPESNNIDEKSTPVVGSMYSENLNDLHDLYVHGNPTTVDELVKYVPTIMRMTPNMNDPKRIDVAKFNKDRSENNLHDFYNQFKNEMMVVSGMPNIPTTNKPEHEPESESENIKLNISGGGLFSRKKYKNRKMKRKSNRHKRKQLRKKTKRNKSKKQTRKRKRRRSKTINQNKA